MKYQAIIFDLDGVLCSTDAYHYEAWKAIADRLEIPFTVQKNDRLRGVSRMDSLDILLEDDTAVRSAQEKLALAQEKNEIYKQLLMQLTPDDIAPGAAAVLAALRKAGVRLAVGSSSKNAPFILQRLQLADAFDVVVDGTQIGNSKPHPEVFLLAAQRMEQSPQACLVVEDAEAGVSAALAGGFAVAGIGGAASDPRATYALQTLAQLTQIVE